VSCWRPSAAALPAAPALQLVQVGPRFSKPVYATSTSADPTAIYVVEQGGRVWKVRVTVSQFKVSGTGAKETTSSPRP
jgi:hypothetical protein